jgi:hypothetical protein
MVTRAPAEQRRGFQNPTNDLQVNRWHVTWKPLISEFGFFIRQLAATSIKHDDWPAFIIRQPAF